MPRQQSLKVYNTFVGGLVTEATPLSFPENAVLAESNCVFDKQGDIRRRLGMDYEATYTLTAESQPEAVWEDKAVGVFQWEEVAGDGNRTFSVVQINDTLHFYDLTTQPISAQKKSFTTDLSAFSAPAATDVGSEWVDVASGKGYLFVTSKKLKPFYIKYDPDLDSITNTEIGIQVRDFDGVDDSLGIDEEIVSLSNEHSYNLKNQGWVSPGGSVADPVATYFTSQSKYPGNNKQWWVAKNATDDFDPDELTKIFFGNTRAPRGHFILDPFNKDRTTVSGVASITTELEDNRPEAVAFFAGRACYGGPPQSSLAGRVYFSQIIEGDSNIGRCYQEADPTSEEISDLVDTDGGVIIIPEAGNIVALRVTGESLLVFADNGVWAISGSAGFSPTDYSVTHIGDAGIIGKHSIVDVQGTPIWWSDRGVFSIGRNEVTDRIEAKSLSEQSIQSYYEDTIPNISKEYTQAVYDPISKKVYWAWNGAGNETSYRFKYDNFLIFDTNIGGFYTYAISSLAVDSPYIFGLFTLPTVARATETVNVVEDATGYNVVENSTGYNVVSTATVLRSFPATLMAIVAVPQATTSEWTFGTFNNTDFLDWETADGTGVDYSSYFTTGYLLEGNVTNNKTAPHILVYSKRTETGYVSDGAGGYNTVNPGSCFMQARWDFADHGNSGKYGRKAQVYRLLKPYDNTPALDYDDGKPVVITRNKVRGKGRALHLHFSSEQGKDFNVYGWAVQSAVNAGM
jgi:hypothetical protein